MPRRITAVLLLALLSTTPFALTQPEHVVWIGLWNPGMLEWAENENRIHRLCPKELEPAEQQQCREKHLPAKTWNIPLYASPDFASKQSGKLVVTVEPGKPLSLAYHPSVSGKPISFTPDLYDPDWGYGPYFHHTVREYRDHWTALPPDPFPSTVWINTSHSLNYQHFISPIPGYIYLLDKQEDVVLVKKDSDAFYFRPPQPADMWCEAGDPPPIKPVPLRRIPIAKLYDKRGHLRLTVKYTRGC